MSADHESPWKELLESDPRRVLAFFYPDIHDDLDWAEEVESLDQEFRAQVPQAEEGKRVADKLLRARCKGTGDLRYLHIEIQSYFEAMFEYRVHVYNRRAEDRYGQPVVSLLILIDDDPKWLPWRYEAELYKTSRTLTFRTVKIRKYAGRKAKLEADANPVGLFVVAYLEGKRLKDDDPARADVKLRLLRNLRRRDLDAEDVRRWVPYLDWLLPLPEEYNRRLWQKVNRTSKEGEMFVSFAERIGREKGRREGLLKAVGLGLKLKFGPDGQALMAEVERLEDPAVLEVICDAIEPAAHIDEIRKLLPPAAGS